MKYQDITKQQICKVIKQMLDLTIEANDSYNLWRNIDLLEVVHDSDEKSFVYNKSPAFFNKLLLLTKKDSLSAMCLVYDGHKDSFGLVNILKSLKSLSERGLINIGINKINSDINLINSKLNSCSKFCDALCKLNKIRNAKVSHPSPDAILGYNVYSEKSVIYSLSHGEFKILIENAYCILSYYYEFISGERLGLVSIGSDGFKKLICDLVEERYALGGKPSITSRIFNVSSS